MLKNAYLLAKIGADTAENEQNFAEFFTKIRLHGSGRCLDARGALEPVVPMGELPSAAGARPEAQLERIYRYGSGACTANPVFLLPPQGASACVVDNQPTNNQQPTTNHVEL